MGSRGTSNRLTHEEQAAQERFEKAVSLFLQNRWDGNKEIETSCELLAETAPDRTLDLILTAIGKAQEKWKRDWKFCFADTSSGLANVLCSVVRRCSDCHTAVPYLQELALSKVQAVEALGFSKDDTVIDWLLEHEVAGDEGSFYPKFASIGRIGGPKAAKVLISYINKPAAREMLAEIGNDAIPALAHALDQGKGLAWLPLRALGWQPQTVNQQILVAILEQDRRPLERFGPHHFEQIADCFDAVYAYREYWEDTSIRSEALGQFRDQCAEKILKNADPPLWFRLMKDLRWYANLAAKLASESGDMDTLAGFVEICSRSGQYLDKMTLFADRFPKEGEDLLLTVAGNTLAAPAARMGAASWLLGRGRAEAYQIIPALTVEICGQGLFGEEWSREWSRVTGLSEDLLACAHESLRSASGSARFPVEVERREEAIEKLCSMRNPLSTAVLQRIAVMPDGEMFIGPEFHETRYPMDFSHLRARAQTELNAHPLHSESLETWYRNECAGQKRKRRADQVK